MLKFCPSTTSTRRQAQSNLHAKLTSGANVSVEPLPAGAHISQCSDETNSSVSSPDSRFVAVCVRDPERSSVVVMDSKAVAVLKESERRGYGPLELVSALSGHPVPYNSIGFVAVGVSENEGVGLPYIAREFRSAWSYIRWQR